MVELLVLFALQTCTAGTMQTDSHSKSPLPPFHKGGFEGIFL